LSRAPPRSAALFLLLRGRFCQLIKLREPDELEPDAVFVFDPHDVITFVELTPKDELSWDCYAKSGGAGSPDYECAGLHEFPHIFKQYSLPYNTFPDQHHYYQILYSQEQRPLLQVFKTAAQDLFSVFHFSRSLLRFRHRDDVTPSVGLTVFFCALQDLDQLAELVLLSGKIFDESQDQPLGLLTLVLVCPLVFLADGLAELPCRVDLTGIHQRYCFGSH
jgi:hypothetical protein